MNSLIYSTGTVSVSGGSAIVTGNLTGWAIALVEGGVFSCDGIAVPILSVEDDTHLTLAYPWPGVTGTGKLYAIARTPSEATARAATWTVDRLAKLAQTPWGIPVTPDGRGTLAQRDALSPMPTDDYVWLRVEVDEPLELYFRVTGQWLGPYQWQGEKGDADTTTAGLLTAHKNDHNNPHAVTAVQVGATEAPESADDGNVAVFDGGSGKLKDAGFGPVDPSELALALGAKADTSAVALALADKADVSALADHATDTDNPHEVTADQVGAATPGKSIALTMVFGG